MLLSVTLAIAAACGAINLWLALRLVPGRMNGIPLGDGGAPAMLIGMRSHANFVEYAPFVLILMALIELARGPSVWLWALGVAFVLARIAHPIGMARQGTNVFRAGGALTTWVVTALLAGWAIAIAVQAQSLPTVTTIPTETVAPNA